MGADGGRKRVDDSKQTPGPLPTERAFLLTGREEETRCPQPTDRVGPTAARRSARVVPHHPPSHSRTARRAWTLRRDRVGTLPLSRAPHHRAPHRRRGTGPRAVLHLLPLLPHAGVQSAAHGDPTGRVLSRPRV